MSDRYRLAAGTDPLKFAVHARAALDPVRYAHDARRLLVQGLLDVDLADITGQPRPSTPLISCAMRFLERDEEAARSAQSPGWRDYDLTLHLARDHVADKVLVLYRGDEIYRAVFEALPGVESHDSADDHDTDAAWDRVMPSIHDAPKAGLSWRLRTGHDTSADLLVVAHTNSDHSTLLSAAEIPDTTDRAVAVARRLAVGATRALDLDIPLLDILRISCRGIEDSDLVVHLADLLDPALAEALNARSPDLPELVVEEVAAQETVRLVDAWIDTRTFR